MNSAKTGSGEYSATGPGYGGAALAELTSPSQTILVLENTNEDGSQKYALTKALADITFQGHLGTTNFLFGDGHVKSMRPNATVTNGLNMWDINPTRTPSSALTGKMGTEATRLAAG